MDKRAFHTLLNDLKDRNPDQFDLLESIQDTFDKSIKPITDSEIRALKTFPIQFIPRIETEDGEWTTKLHNWAENGVYELVDIDPMILTHKNSLGDSVLMSLVSAATGAFTETVNYDLIKKILNTDFSYEEKEASADKEQIIVKNAIDEVDIYGQTVIDYLIDFAYGAGKYAGQAPDLQLQQLLTDFSNGTDTDIDAVPEPIDYLKSME